MSKYTVCFEHFIGRKLTHSESRIITALEYTRLYCANHRVYITDEPGYDSRNLLCAYYNYLHFCIDPDGAFLVMAKTKRDAAKFSGSLSKPKTPWLTLASNQKFNEIHGKTFNYALVLDANACNTNAPRRQKFSNNRINHHKHHPSIINSFNLDAVDPFIITESNNYFIIVHIRKEQFSIFNIIEQVLPAYVRVLSVPIPRLWQSRPGLNVNDLPLKASLPNAPPTLNSKLSTLHHR